MREPVEVVLTSMMQTIDKLDGVPDSLNVLFMSMDRIYPHWRIPTSNLANPPILNELKHHPMNIRVTFTCPNCGLGKENSFEHSNDLIELANALARFRSSNMCAHDDDKAGMSVDVQA